MAKPVPELSVVIPTFNGLPYLERQLEALADERPTVAFEVILADNGSTDASVEAGRRFADRLDLRVIDASSERGRCFARNEGVRHARGSAIVLLDQDDEIAPGYLDAMARALRRHAVVAARIDPGALNPGWLASVREEGQIDELRGGDRPWAVGGSMGIRRDVFDRVGGFDPGLHMSGEDVDLCWRLTQQGDAIAFVPDAVLRYRYPHTLPGLFRQGRRYGRGQGQLSRKYPLVARDQRAVSWLRGLAGSIRRATLGRDPGTRANGWFLLGKRVGAVEEALRYRRPR